MSERLPLEQLGSETQNLRGSEIRRRVFGRTAKEYGSFFLFFPDFDWVILVPRWKLKIASNSLLITKMQEGIAARYERNSAQLAKKLGN